MTSNISQTAVSRSGIRKIVIDSERSESVTFEGTSFGSVGQYEKIRGVAYGELDPSDHLNTVITDIEYAALNPQGMIDYSMDIFILKPKDLRKGNHRVLFDFNKYYWMY